MDADSISTIESVAATRVFDAFRNYNQRFREITRRAARHFESGDRATGRLDAVRRIELYNKSVAAVIQDLRTLPADPIASRDSWRRIKDRYAELIADCADSEFYKTFFSSVTRRLFDTIGVDPQVEFLAADVAPQASDRYRFRTRSYVNRGSLPYLFDEMLGDLPFSRRFRDIDATLSFIVAEIDAWRAEEGIDTEPESVEVIPPLFYRGRRAYLVGRLLGRDWQVPLVIPFANTPEGILVDVVILTENEVSKLFGFTTSYFHVDLDVVGSEPHGEGEVTRDLLTVKQLMGMPRVNVDPLESGEF
jgi:isocitrate dehydrogenase kinase/phosphatase